MDPHTSVSWYNVLLQGTFTEKKKVTLLDDLSTEKDPQKTWGSTARAQVKHLHLNNWISSLFLFKILCTEPREESQDLWTKPDPTESVAHPSGLDKEEL